MTVALCSKGVGDDTLCTDRTFDHTLTEVGFAGGCRRFSHKQAIRHRSDFGSSHPRTNIRMRTWQVLASVGLALRFQQNMSCFRLVQRVFQRPSPGVMFLRRFADVVHHCRNEFHVPFVAQGCRNEFHVPFLTHHCRNESRVSFFVRGCRNEIHVPF